jgi:hypothetical protein
MSDTRQSGGIGLLALLGVVFVVLRLLHKIDWPWLWVLAPFWAPYAIGLALLAVWGLGFALYLLVIGARGRRRRRARRDILRYAAMIRHPAGKRKL